MDPLSITAASGSLAATIFNLVKTIGSFVATVRNSRSELDAVSRELVSLQVCVEVLENDRRNGVIFGHELEVSVNQVLVNIQLCCGQIESMLAKLKANRFGRQVKWPLLQKDQMNELRSSLEKHKSALQMALQLNTISILIKEFQNVTSLQSSSTRQTHATLSAIQQVNQDVHGLASAQEARLQRLNEAMADMSSLIKEIVPKHENLFQLVQQSCSFLQDALTPIHQLEGVLEIESRFAESLDDPFSDPLSEAYSGTQEPAHEKSGRYPSTDCRQCDICSSRINEADSLASQAKLQQMKIDWRQEWTTQLKRELASITQRDGGAGPESLTGFSTIKTHSTVTPATSEVDDVSGLLTDILTITSWDDSHRTSGVSEIGSLASSTNTTSSNIADKLQRLRRRYDSVCQRNQMLIEEITDLKSDNLEFQNDISRLRDRMARSRAAPASQSEALQREIESQHELIDEMTGKYTDLENSYHQLHERHKAENERANAVSRDLETLQSEVITKSEGIKSLEAQISAIQPENARLRELEIELNQLKHQKHDTDVRQKSQSGTQVNRSMPFELYRPSLDELPYGVCIQLLQVSVYDSGFYWSPVGSRDQFESMIEGRIASARGCGDFKIVFDYFTWSPGWGGGEVARLIATGRGRSHGDQPSTPKEFLQGFFSEISSGGGSANVHYPFPERLMSNLDRQQSLTAFIKGRFVPLEALIDDDASPWLNQYLPPRRILFCWIHPRDKLRFNYTEYWIRNSRSSSLYSGFCGENPAEGHPGASDIKHVRIVDSHRHIRELEADFKEG